MYFERFLQIGNTNFREIYQITSFLDDDDSLFDWDKEILKEELNRIKKVISLEGEYDGMYVTEDGQIYNQMYKALEHAKENPLCILVTKYIRKKSGQKRMSVYFGIIDLAN